MDSIFNRSNKSTGKYEFASKTFQKQQKLTKLPQQVPFSDNNTRIEWDEPLEDDVDVRIVEEVRPVRLGDQQQQPPLQERNRQENASRVVATSPALEIIRPQAPGPLDLRRTKTHLAPKWAAASLRGKLLIEQVQNLQRAPATSPVDFRPPATASTAQTPQLAPGALFTNDPRNVPRPSHPVPIDASMGDELQNERSTFLESPYPNSLGNPSFDDVHSPLGDSRIEKGLTSIIEVNKEIERFFAPGNRPGGGQQVAAHQGVEGNRNPVFGGSANMIPINGGGYPHTQNGSEREAPKAQGTPYMHNAPARAPPRAPTSQYKSPYTKDAMSPYTKNSTDSYPNNSAVRGPQIAGANVNTQSMPTREPPRKEGEFSRVHTALLLDASKAGKVMPEERLSKNLSSVPTNPSFLRNSSTSESASPFAGVIHSPGPSKTPSNTKYHNSSTYPDPEPNSTDEAPAKSRIGDHRTSSFRVEINSSPMPLLHGPPSRFQSGKKRGRPFANPEAAAKAVEKAARQQLSETGENTGKKRGRPFATAEAAEKAAKKMKSTSDESEEPKKRGRPFATEKKIEAPDPCFPVFYCEWKGCPAELHNLETLRKHLHILHGKRDKVTGMIPCMFRKCANSHTETKAAGEGIEASSDIAKENFGEKKAAGEETETSPDIAKEDSGHELLYPIAFKKRSDWHAHLEEEHLIPIAWHLGDGPKFTEYCKSANLTSIESTLTFV